MLVWILLGAGMGFILANWLDELFGKWSYFLAVLIFLLGVVIYLH